MALKERYPASTLQNWRFRDFHMALDRGGLNQGTFLTSEACFIAAGPARVADLAGGSLAGRVIPMAITDSVAINQNKMLQQIFEIGSRRSYFIGGRVTGAVNLARPMFFGPSLLRVLTGATRDYENLENNAGLGSDGADGARIGRAYSELEPELYINLQAEIFDRACGLLFYFLDQRKNPYGAFYVEDANVQAHGAQIAAQAPSIVENVSMMFDRVVPVIAAQAAA